MIEAVAGNSRVNWPIVWRSFREEVDIYHAVVKREDADVSTVVDVVAPYDGVAVVFHPDARERIVADLVVFVDALQHRTLTLETQL